MLAHARRGHLTMARSRKSHKASKVGGNRSRVGSRGREARMKGDGRRGGIDWELGFEEFFVYISFIRIYDSSVL